MILLKGECRLFQFGLSKKEFHHRDGRKKRNAFTDLLRDWRRASGVVAENRTAEEIATFLTIMGTGECNSTLRERTRLRIEQSLQKRMPTIVIPSLSRGRVPYL